MTQMTIDTEKIKAFAEKLKNPEFKTKFHNSPAATLRAEGINVPPEAEKQLSENLENIRSKSGVGNTYVPIYVHT
jgi:hypothetical protein